MSQRNSGYARIDGDTYVTPRWVYEALYEVEPWARDAEDVAPVNSAFDWLSTTPPPCPGNIPIATNPPFRLSEQFVRHSIKCRERVAMLLPHAWDTAKSRSDLFVLKPFKAKYTLLKRIRWENVEQKKAGPSSNHAWFVWDWTYDRPPIMGWLP